jgi:catechol 2,3-dioxygenase-like lactoylglutathione lyase family enzyme
MSGLVVRPVRFTDNVEEMRHFLEVLGLRPRIESNSGGWVDLLAASGMVALHSAKDSLRGSPSGVTALSFEASDIDALADRLRAAAVRDVTVYDEAYGRVLVCTDPFGDQIAVDERADDLYGYRRHDAQQPASSLVAVVVRFCDLDGPYATFLTALGLHVRGATDYVAAYEPDPAGGQVLLHPPAEGMPPFAEEPGAARLSFETGEPMEVIGERLSEAGFPVTLCDQSFGRTLEVMDADGLAIEVHPAP